MSLIAEIKIPNFSDFWELSEKVRSKDKVRPKLRFNFGIVIRAEIFLAETETFFFKFFNISYVFLLICGLQVSESVRVLTKRIGQFGLGLGIRPKPK